MYTVVISSNSAATFVKTLLKWLLKHMVLKTNLICIYRRGKGSLTCKPEGAA